jgi:predicted PurR-regulated permease PerM
MLVFGFHYPLLISVIVAVTSLIPVVGPIIGAIPAIFILLMAEPLQVLWFIVFIVLLQQFEGNIIYPRVVGHSIGLPPLWVLIAIIISGGLMGVLGMLISVPAVSVLYQLLKEDVNKK